MEPPWRGIENQLHRRAAPWQLDVTFAEDSALIKDRNGAQNLHALRKTVLALLKQETSQQYSLAKKRKMAAWDDNYLFKILQNEPVK
ncbi:MAG: hypothetical protein AAF632_13640 [Bacteroidota bacterium]